MRLTQILKKKTHKLFYNKWPFKIECFQKHSSTVYRFGIARTIKWLDGDTTDSWLWKGAVKADIREFIEAFAKISNSDIKVRAEGGHFNIFVKDKDLYKKAVKVMDRWITAITEPGSDEEYDFLINNAAKKVLCNELPKGGFRYRVFIRTRMKPDARLNFHSWISRYTGKFDVAVSTTKWLTGVRSYTQDPFFYVYDQPTLSMAGLYLGDNVKRVEEFIPRDKINN